MLKDTRLYEDPTGMSPPSPIDLDVEHPVEEGEQKWDFEAKDQLDREKHDKDRFQQTQEEREAQEAIRAVERFQAEQEAAEFRRQEHRTFMEEMHSPPPPGKRLRISMMASVSCPGSSSSSSSSSTSPPMASTTLHLPVPLPGQTLELQLRLDHPAAQPLPAAHSPHLSDAPTTKKAQPDCRGQDAPLKDPGEDGVSLMQRGRPTRTVCCPSDLRSWLMTLVPTVRRMVVRTLLWSSWETDLGLFVLAMLS